MPDKKEFDIAEFLGSLDATDAEKQALQAVFAKEKNVNEVKRGWNSVSEGSRLADEARTAAAAAATEKQAAAAEKADADRLKAEAQAETEKNRTWFAGLKKYEGDFTQTKAERDALAAEKLAYEQYLESIGVEPSLALSGKQPIRPNVQPPAAPGNGNGDQPVFDETKFADLLSKQGYVKQSDLQPAAQLMVNLPFELQQVQMRHFELYGKFLPPAKIPELQSAYLNPQNSRTLMDIATESLHFADREKEIAEQQLKETAETMAKDMYEKRMSELQLPAAILDRIQSDVPVRFGSEEFAKNTSRATDATAAEVSSRDMQEFLRIDGELAAMNIRPNL